jgi:hypothetical protein
MEGGSERGGGRSKRRRLRTERTGREGRRGGGAATKSLTAGVVGWISTSSQRTDVRQQRPDTHTEGTESSFLSLLLLTVIFSPFLEKSILRLFSAFPSWFAAVPVSQLQELQRIEIEDRREKEVGD